MRLLTIKELQERSEELRKIDGIDHVIIKAIIQDDALSFRVSLFSGNEIIAASTQPSLEYAEKVALKFASNWFGQNSKEETE